MEIKQVNYSDECVLLEAIGKVTRNGWSPGSEPLSDSYGPGIYGRSVLLSLQRVQHIDSTGVEWLLSCHNKFNEGGGKIILHSATPTVEQLLKMMRMHLVLNLAADEPAAKEQIGNVDHGDASGG